MEERLVAVEHKTSQLEDVLQRFITHTNAALSELHREMLDFKEDTQAFKDEMRAFKDEMKAFKDEMLEFKNEMKAFKDEMLEFKNGVNVFKDEMLEFKNEMKAFKDEMLDFKDEMRAFKDEMLDFKNGVNVFKDEMLDFKDEMKAFKDEMLEFRRQSDRDRKEMNKRWGELANKMGTIVEDIIFPAVRPVIKKYFECDPDFLGMRMQRKKGELREEFDVIATCGNSVILIEVKSTPRVQYISEFLKKVERFKELFPEYGDRRVIPIVASLSMDEGFVNALSKNEIYAMAYREWDYMDILNYDRVKKAELS